MNLIASHLSSNPHLIPGSTEKGAKELKEKIPNGLLSATAIALLALLVVSCSEEKSNSEIRSPERMEEPARSNKKITIPDIIESASASDRYATAQMRTWAGSAIDIDVIKRQVSHLPDVLQKEEYDKIFAQTQEATKNNAEENRSLRLLREVFLKSTNFKYKSPLLSSFTYSFAPKIQVMCRKQCSPN